jgi:hypothetical protein
MKGPVFKVTPNPTFSEFVRLSVPGHPVPARISITWRHKTGKEVEAWFESNKDRPAVDGLDEVIAGWGEPVLNDKGEEEPGISPIGADGEKLPYTREALASILSNYSASTDELVRGYVLALRESRVKNL